MKRTVLLVCIAALFFFSVPRNAQACDCVQVGERIHAKKWIVSFKGAVFLGKAKKIVEVQVPVNDSQFYLEREVTFEVEESWKGVESAEVKVRTGIGGGDCGVLYTEGERYFVSAHLLEGKLKTDICGDMSLSEAAQTIRELGTGKKRKK